MWTRSCAWSASGAVKRAIDTKFTIEHIVDALTYVHEGRAHGKVVNIPCFDTLRMASWVH